MKKIKDILKANNNTNNLLNKRILASTFLYGNSIKNFPVLLFGKEGEINRFLKKIEKTIKEEEEYYLIENFSEELLYNVKIYKENNFTEKGIMYLYNLENKKTKEDSFFGFIYYDKKANELNDYFTFFKKLMEEKNGDSIIENESSKEKKKIWDLERTVLITETVMEDTPLYPEELMEKIGEDLYEEILDFFLLKNKIKLKNLYKKIY